ncbi:multi-sensor signal transduction histidine kinase [Haloferax elongans ATCC BAA-1513]|uniref:Multi-sensor signal transduction histidine kinase n=1 Tax=Haloferax elongans ATCC BAA-1513 TaxID=1230453 RepID=M0HG28_HALEO|nr:PAS domain-containing protein [Haloferax elongans]ELZ82702.1 multi-sensor signal transduction histidine kinase [Haloferax elongans ATCC BAA-1513]
MSRGEGAGTAHAITTGERENPIRVLHVDDDASFAELTSTLLERESTAGPPLEVQTETDPTAVDPPLGTVDCVVSDYDMPVVDGLELLEKVRQHHPGLPFILFTGRGSEEIASKAISAGVTDYLRKGGRRDRFGVLANRIRNVVAKRRAEQSARQSTRLLRNVIDHLPQCVFVKDIEGQYLLINENGAETYGGSPEDIEGKTESEVNDPETAAQFREEDRQVIEQGVARYISDQHVVAEDGAERVERVMKFPFDIESASTPAVLGIAEDVTTERRKTAQLDAAATLVERLRSHLESSGGRRNGVDETSGHVVDEKLATLVDELETVITDPQSVDVQSVLRDDDLD